MSKPFKDCKESHFGLFQP